MEFLFIASMEKKKIETKSICHFCSFSILHLSSRKALKEKKNVNEFAEYMCFPLTDIIHSSMSLGQWPSCYKKEILTLIPNEYPVILVDMR